MKTENIIFFSVRSIFISLMNTKVVFLLFASVQVFIKAFVPPTSYAVAFTLYFLLLKHFLDASLSAGTTSTSGHWVRATMLDTGR